MKEKTLFQKQIEINEKQNSGKIEFTQEHDKSINESLNHLNSKDELKDE